MKMMEYAEKFIGAPYIYGANGAGAFDCSSFVSEVLMAYGWLPNKANYSAQMIHDKMRMSLGSVTAVMKGKAYAPGDILIFGKEFFKGVSHVELAYNSEMWLGCAGGDSTTTTIEEARRIGAMVRLRPAGYRLDLMAAWRIL